MLHKLILTYIISLTYVAAFCQTTYPDAHLPMDTPRLFAEGLISDGLSNRDFTISPAGTEIFFTIQQPRFASSTILYLVKSKNGWTKPQVAPFSGQYRDLEAAFSPDGKTIFFSSDRPLNGKGNKKDFDIWKVSKLSSGKWSAPENLGSTVNTNKNEFYPSITKSGNLYFTVEAEYGKGKEDIAVCKPDGKGNYSKPESLPEAINTSAYEFNAFVDPDEQFILFSSEGRDEGMGGGDLYISRKDGQGNWQKAKLLPVPINSSGLDYCPFVTWDKKYLIFTSNRLDAQFANGRPKNYEELKKLLSSAGNGWDDLYWVRFNAGW